MNKNYILINYPEDKNSLSVLFLESMKCNLPFVLVETRSELKRITISYEMTGEELPDFVVSSAIVAIKDKGFLYCNDNSIQIILVNIELENFLNKVFSENNSDNVKIASMRKENFINVSNRIIRSLQEILTKLNIDEKTKISIEESINNAHKLYHSASCRLLWEGDDYPFTS